MQQTMTELQAKVHHAYSASTPKSPVDIAKVAGIQVKSATLATTHLLRLGALRPVDVNPKKKCEWTYLNRQKSIFDIDGV